MLAHSHSASASQIIRGSSVLMQTQLRVATREACAGANPRADADSSLDFDNVFCLGQYPSCCCASHFHHCNRDPMSADCRGDASEQGFAEHFAFRIPVPVSF
eukprot:2542579-Rhodomonas_salina.3